MDRLGADFEKVLDMMSERLSAKPLILNFPIGRENDFKGVIDVLKQKAYYWEQTSLGVNFTETEIPSEYIELSAQRKNTLIEMLADYDDEIMHNYLEGIETPHAVVKQAIRKATIENKIVPGKVLGQGELKNKVKIVALSFSEKAKEKLKSKETLTIIEEIKKNPEGKDIQILTNKTGENK